MKRVMVFGTFDILHPGHIYFLKQAKKYGDFLIVSIARQKHIQRIKGRDAIHSEQERKKLLESIKYVNKVVLGSKDDYIGHILRQKPDIIVLGYDQKHFTERLGRKLGKKGLNVRIVRLKAYKSGIYKSSKFLHGKAL